MRRATNGLQGECNVTTGVTLPCHDPTCVTVMHAVIEYGAQCPSPGGAARKESAMPEEKQREPQQQQGQQPPQREQEQPKPQGQPPQR